MRRRHMNPAASSPTKVSIPVDGSGTAPMPPPFQTLVSEMRNGKSRKLDGAGEPGAAKPICAVWLGPNRTEAVGEIVPPGLLLPAVKPVETKLPVASPCPGPCGSVPKKVEMSRGLSGTESPA